MDAACRSIELGFEAAYLEKIHLSWRTIRQLRQWERRGGAPNRFGFIGRLGG